MKKKGYRYSLDPFLLADFVYLPKEAEMGIDLGTGSGIILFLLDKRGAETKFIGLERQWPLLLEAKKAEKEHGGDGISFIRGDIRSSNRLFAPGSFDLVVSNPPYRRVGEGRINPDPERAAARHEIHITLSEIVARSAYLLRDMGRLFLIHLPERLEDILALMEGRGIRPVRLRFVHSLPNKEATMVLVEGIRGGRGTLRVESPLFVYGGDGVYSPEMESIYSKFDS